MATTRDEGGNDANDPEDEREEERAYWQPKAFCHHPKNSFPVVVRHHLFLRPIIRFYPNIGCLFRDLIRSMVNNFQEGDGHREEHPNIDHLDIGRDRHALRESKKSRGEIQI